MRVSIYITYWQGSYWLLHAIPLLVLKHSVPLLLLLSGSIESFLPLPPSLHSIIVTGPARETGIVCDSQGPGSQQEIHTCLEAFQFNLF